MDIRIIRDAITKEELRTIAAQQFGDMVKTVSASSGDHGDRRRTARR
jgi:hypothetical protein